MKENFLIITTYKDISFPLFFDAEFKRKYDVTVLIINDVISRTVRLNNKKFEKCYIRDLFNDSRVALPDINNILDQFISDLNITTFIDNVSTFESLLIEDKWEQYKRFKKFMPKTTLLNQKHEFAQNSFIIKKRISSRSKDIHFSIEEIVDNHSNYIIQEKIDIEKEWRVLEINNNILPFGLVKESKTESNRLKVVGKEPVSSDLKGFIKDISMLHNFNFVGYDIVQTKNSEYILIELNRSPQFARYYDFIGENPIAHL